MEATPTTVAPASTPAPVSKTDGAVEAALRMQQCDAQLSAIAKEFSHGVSPVVLPRCLQPTDGTAAPPQQLVCGRARKQQSNDSAAGGEDPTLGDLDGAAALAEFTRKGAEYAAHRECNRRVPGLASWLLRAQTGRQEGQQCLTTLHRLAKNLKAMESVTCAVREQSDHLSSNVSALMVKRGKLERVQEALQETIRHFTDIDDLSREAEHPLLSATSARFSVLMQKIEDEMGFLSSNSQFKASKQYATKLAMAQQRALMRLKESSVVAFIAAQKEVMNAPQFKEVESRNRVNHAQNPTSPPRAGSGPQQQQLGSTASTPLVPSTLVSPTGDGVVSADVADKVMALSSFPPAENVDSIADEMDDPVAFIHRIAALNGIYVKKLEETTSLRRNLELHCGSNAEDANLSDTLNAYRDTRMAIVGPLLRDALRVRQPDADTSAPASTTSARPLPPPPSQSPSPIAGSGQPTPPTNSNVATESQHSPDASLATSSGSPAPAAAPRTFSSSLNYVSGFIRGVTNRDNASNTKVAFLIPRICSILSSCLQEEKEVNDILWLREDVNTTIYTALSKDLGTAAYQVFRSHLVKVDDINELSDTIRIATEAKENAYDSATPAITDIMVRLIQDAQERIIFRTSVFLRQHIQLCRPTKAEAEQMLRAAVDMMTPKPVDNQDVSQEVEGGQGSVQATPPPPITPQKPAFHTVMVNCVFILQRLYAVLEVSAFSVFAEEAINYTLQHLSYLRNMMAEQTNVTRNAPLHASLLQLYHLMYLREQLSRIDANIVVVEKSLDLSQIGQRRLGITQSSRESKRDVESEMKVCCEKVIQLLIDDVSSPLVGVATKSASDTQERVVLAERQYEKDEELLGKYIAAPSTRSVLLRPVRSRLDELCEEVALLRARDTASAATSTPEATLPPAPQHPTAEPPLKVDNTQPPQPVTTTITPKEQGDNQEPSLL